MLLDLLLALFGDRPRWPALLALACLLVAAALKLALLARIDGGAARSTPSRRRPGSAASAQVRPLEPPHTEPNYVMREMGYRIARKHAEKLRQLVLLLAFAVPIAGRC